MLKISFFCNNEGEYPILKRFRGAKATHRLDVESFPVAVVIEFPRENLYETGRKAYLKKV